MVVVVGHQTAASAAGAAIELHPQKTERVNTKTNGALGIARLNAQQETLSPSFGLRLAASGRCGVSALVAIVAVKIEVTQFQASLGVFDEGGLSHGWDSQCCSQSGEGHAPGDGGLEHFLFLLVG